MFQALDYSMSARKSPEKAPKEKTSFITWEGRKIPMEWQASGWRLRSRSKHFTVDYSTNILALRAAQDDAREYLKNQKAKEKPKGKMTLEDVVKIYKTLPKRASEVTEYTAISHLRSVVRVVMDKELNEVLATEIDAKFWLRYIAKRQGREVADLSTRDPINKAINSGMNNAMCVFKEALIPLYAEHGIVFCSDVSVIQWMAMPKLPKPTVSNDLVKELKALKGGPENDLWQAIGAARFAGLRRTEIMHLAKHWVEIDGAATYIRIRDRPEEGFKHKTGESYRALVVDEEYAAFLRAAPDGYIVQPDLQSKRPRFAHRPNSRRLWFWYEPQKWLKPFTGEKVAPLHRMRGLYLDDVAKLTEDAVKARLEGVKAAKDSAGHTSTKTTEDHYLTKKL